MEQSDTIDRLQEKVSDLGRLERHLGREQVRSIVERAKVLEQAERAIYPKEFYKKILESKKFVPLRSQ